MKVKEIKELADAIKDRIANPSEYELCKRREEEILDKCVRLIKEGKNDKEHAAEVLNEYVDFYIEKDYCDYFMRNIEGTKREKALKHFHRLGEDLSEMARHLRGDEISEKRLLELCLESEFVIGVDKASARLRGGSYIGGCTDYHDHRGDGMAEVIKEWRDEMERPRTEQRCNYGTKRWDGGDMFDTIVYQGKYGGYSIYFGYSNESGKATMSGSEYALDRFNDQVMAGL